MMSQPKPRPSPALSPWREWQASPECTFPAAFRECPVPICRLWADKSHLLSAFDNVVKGYTFRQHCQEHSLSVCRKVRQCEKENILKTYCTQDLTVAAFRVTVALPLGGAFCITATCDLRRSSIHIGRSDLYREKTPYAFRNDAGAVSITVCECHTMWT